ncbi:GspE/PulE family protein [Methylobacillus flagellatus]|uniref:GspE/PulE family protein n=1 Tax=Methylobacillus flagellatus TaxID=405 RepID=UPI0010F74C05|nr:GspE/PulE family protein [Methylobacillus flagellatus]
MNAPLTPPLFSPALLATARTQAASNKRRLVQVLEELTGLAQADFMHWLADVSGYDTMSMDELHQWPVDFGLISFTECLQRECLLLRPAAAPLLLLVTDPFDQTLRTWAWQQLRVQFTFRLVHHSDLQAYFTRQEESQRALTDWSQLDEAATGAGQDGEIISLKSIAEDSSPVVRLVHSTLYDALKAGVSDIHLETSASGLTIKYRIDGVLSVVGSMQGLETAEQVLSRLKIMSELDIAERRIPQDGRFKLLVQGRAVDFRVSIMPSIHGEDAVLRILDKQSLTSQMQGLRLEILGFDDETLRGIRKLSHEPYGMVLVTGPTGSGKTTTLYAAISEINNGHDKIITIEDPVEYQLPGILQIPVNEKKGLSFARGLRSILRHDPDKIMVGEIRDPETAQIAIQSALTGHLVFTTVHANNVFDVLGRFLHMGVDVYSFVSALNGIVAQRLVRINCSDCSVPVTPEAALLEASGLDAQACADYAFHAGRGCGKCRGSGYRGRKAIAELLVLNDELRELIIAREPIRVIKQAAIRHHTRFLRDSALALVRRGETTLEEINRVTFVS